MIDFRKYAFQKGYNVKTVVKFNGVYVTLEQYNNLIADPAKIELFKGTIMEVKTQEQYWETLKPSKAPILKPTNTEELSRNLGMVIDEPEHISSCIKRFMNRHVKDMKYDWNGKNA